MDRARWLMVCMILAREKHMKVRQLATGIASGVGSAAPQSAVCSLLQRIERDEGLQPLTLRRLWLSPADDGLCAFAARDKLPQTSDCSLPGSFVGDQARADLAGSFRSCSAQKATHPAELC